MWTMKNEIKKLDFDIDTKWKEEIINFMEVSKLQSNSKYLSLHFANEINCLK